MKKWPDRTEPTFFPPLNVGNWQAHSQSKILGPIIAYFRETQNAPDEWSVANHRHLPEPTAALGRKPRAFE